MVREASRFCNVSIHANEFPPWSSICDLGGLRFRSTGKSKSQEHVWSAIGCEENPTVGESRTYRIAIAHRDTAKVALASYASVYLSHQRHMQVENNRNHRGSCATTDRFASDCVRTTAHGLRVPAAVGKPQLR